MTEQQIEREQVANVFCLGGGELHEPHPDFPDAWDGHFAYWHEEAPEWADESDRDGADPWECRTAYACILFGGPKVPKGWELVRSFISSGEAECWHCGPGTDYDGSEEQDAARKAEPNTNTCYRGDPECVLCEGGGYVYLGDGWAVLLFRPIDS